jgi:retron-type reverse transcriptase
MKNTHTKSTLRSKIVYKKDIAISFSKMAYYEVLGEDIRKLPGRDKEKLKFSTPRQERVTKLLANYKKRLMKKANGYFHILKGIYNENCLAIRNSLPPPKHTNLLSLVASIPNLIVSYKKIRSNKGASTLGAMLSYHDNKRLNPLQRRLINSTLRAPDGLTYQIFELTSQLLKQGKYPWGASRRIYIDKPGQPGKLRPITIPPFMDRVVQTAILAVLESIYEPWFQIQNRSFGFRKGKGVHDAIYATTRMENKGYTFAIEGDIKGAYDNVNREKLITILSKRIMDRKLLKLIHSRLDYTFFDMNENKYVKESHGIPQGGIDSPYLWNIYMMEFDVHIQEYLNQLFNKINDKVLGPGVTSPRFLPKITTRLRTERRSLLKKLRLLRKINTKEKYDAIISQKTEGWNSIRILLKGINFGKSGENTKEIRYSLIKRIHSIRALLLSIPATEPGKAYLRFIYLRYADDWIIMGRFRKQLAVDIKNYIRDWLSMHLDAKLAEDKTLITDLQKGPAHFLGFEIYRERNAKLAYVNGALTRTTGWGVKAYPDKQRLISRLHMKGYCTEDGKPKPMSWMSRLETFALISRFNSVLLGLGNFYYGFVPKSSLNRWIYIIRFCLLKTLAQKYNTTIKGIFRRFGIRTPTGNTISYRVRNIFERHGKETAMSKTWTLLTELELQKRCIGNLRYSFCKKVFNKIEYDKDINPIPSGSKSDPSVKDESWIDHIHWVNLRTSASFDLPCCICGSPGPIQMHHIKHIRKTKYSSLSENKPHLRVMALRNRKQIPVCRNCHLNRIHGGTYYGANLKHFVSIGTPTNRGYDNRLINIENQINKSDKEYYAKTLVEKGWVKDSTDT